MSRLILASASPRRKELLRYLGYNFSIEVCDLEENSDKTKPCELVMDLAKTKAEAIMNIHGDEDIVVIGSDTVVAYEDTILGKARDREHAKEMILSLQGRTHQVYTGVCICYENKKLIQNLTFYEKTDVFVHPMTVEEIEAYLDKKDGGFKLENTGKDMSDVPYEWEGKAGSYAIQGYFSAYVQGISGDYNNVVGLPVARIYQEIKKLGLVITND